MSTPIGITHFNIASSPQPCDPDNLWTGLDLVRQNASQLPFYDDPVSKRIIIKIID